MKHELIANGTKTTVTVKIDGEQYAEFLRLKNSGLMEYQAVARVLGIDENTDFVTNDAGTSSAPEDALFVKFF